MSDPREPDMSKREALLVHIEGLQATLTKRNARIAELETQLSAGTDSPLVERAIRKAYQNGWQACAGHLMETTREAAVALGNVRRDAWRVYLGAESSNHDTRNPPAAPTTATHASDRAQVGTTGRLDAKTAQTGAQHSNERNE